MAGVLPKIDENEDYGGEDDEDELWKMIRNWYIN